MYSLHQLSGEENRDDQVPDCSAFRIPTLVRRRGPANHNATWNLGWHMDQATVQSWIGECSKTYALDASTGLWKPSVASDAKQGWDIDAFKIEGWDTGRLAVCSVYFAGGTVRVTLEAYKKRQEDIAKFIASSVPADVLAFQEVSGEQAIREVLPNGGSDYELCPVKDYKVQRLVIAWKKTLGTQVSCDIENALSLPTNPDARRPRPGLSLTLTVDGSLLRVMTVHLKSSCVSPFESKGNLAGGGDHCPVLQQQIGPLESWIERESADGAKLVLLGDFNRNLWHELRDQGPVRTDASDPAAARPSGALTLSIFKEVSDGVPSGSQLKMLDEHCPTNEVGQVLCTLSEIRDLEPAESSLLASPTYVGCRNPVGLDHILVGPGVRNKNGAQHISIGGLGATKRGNDAGVGQVLPISDHCPMMATLDF